MGSVNNSGPYVSSWTSAAPKPIANLSGYTQTGAGSGNVGIKLVQPTISGKALQPAANTAQMTGTLNAVNSSPSSNTTTNSPVVNQTNGQTTSQITGNINNVNNAALKLLDQRENVINTRLNKALGDTKSYYDQSFGLLGEGIQLGQGNIDKSRRNNALNLRNSVDKINTGLRNQILGGQIRLGDNGAAFSSAAKMIPIVLGEEAAMDTNDFNQQYVLTEDDINDTQKQFDLNTKQAKLSLEQQYQSAVDNITQTAIDALSAIEEARINAGGAQRQALDALAADITQRFYDGLIATESSFNQKLAGITPQTSFNVANFDNVGNNIVQRVDSSGYQFQPSFQGGPAPSPVGGFTIANLFNRNNVGKDGILI